MSYLVSYCWMVSFVYGRRSNRKSMKSATKTTNIRNQQENQQG